ncbi:HD domain-containing phosphohydrolase [Allorhizobium undicola]|uniref:HD domain-containing phosphohydrolase n=1 Tax=Allorhizobium undicola TaxID=78527 RepID=UPI003D3532CD
MDAVLIDDSRAILAVLTRELETLDGLSIRSFTDPEEAVAACTCQPFDLVIVDYNMPKLTGVQVIRALRQMPDYAMVPIVMVTSQNEAALRLEALQAGATDFLLKPVDALELKVRVTNLLTLRRSQLALAQRADDLADAVREKTAELALREEEIIWRLARAIEYRDGATGDHVSRVARLSRLLAEAIGLPKEVCRMIYLAAPLHDIGKIGIPDSVLCKAGALDAQERALMCTHVTIGERILADGSSDLLQFCERIAAGHHEKWNGEGYPRGLLGEATPLEARIVALADVFDALCSDRPYKSGWPLEKARDFVAEQAGQHFDPRLVEAFLQNWSSVRAIMEEAGTASPPLSAAHSSLREAS